MVTPILTDEVVPASVAAFQVRQYILDRIAAPPVASDPQQWTAEARQLRQRML